MGYIKTIGNAGFFRTEIFMTESGIWQFCSKGAILVL
ncbi:MAG: hypothetical protein K0R10_2991 [Alphaproteobacteria bacterium]|jgi:hypothetical protein|nr:hypothetical protein [Alphaproteobacteria bacterium]